MESIYDFAVTTIDGQQTTLAEYREKVLLIVNVASKCGFTSQYDGLERLYSQYRDQGLVILGFPCNQFGNQEPGTEAEIMDFCRLNYGVSFPLFAKIAVNGPDTHPLFTFLKNARPGFLGSTAIKWNFTKFLVDRTGQVTARLASATPPESIAEEIRRLL
jgi:glutathione peroxidase